MKAALSFLIAVFGILAAAQDVSILTSSCAASDFLAAASDPGNPCSATDYACQCTTGKQFTQDFVTKAITANSGKCTLGEITQLPSLAERFCDSVPGVGRGATSGNSTGSSTSGSVSTPGSTPASTPPSFAGAATRNAIGGVAGLVGAAALFVL